MLAWAGAHDYYECTDAGGAVSRSVEPCARGEKQRRVKDDSAPITIRFDKSVGGMVRLESGAWGNYYSSALINGVPARVIVDTGASMVAVSPTMAVRTGLDRLPFRPGWSQTANGVTPVRYVVVDSVQLGGNVVRNVAGSILSKDQWRQGGGHHG